MRYPRTEYDMPHTGPRKPKADAAGLITSFLARDTGRRKKKPKTVVVGPNDGSRTDTGACYARLERFAAGSGRPVMYAREKLPVAAMHPSLAFTRLGAHLREYAGDGSTAGALAHAVLTNAHPGTGEPRLNKPLDLTPLRILADYMQDEGSDHPLAHKFNWHTLPDKVALDQHLAREIKDENENPMHREEVIPEYFMDDWRPSGRLGTILDNTRHRLMHHHQWASRQDISDSARRLFGQQIDGNNSGRVVVAGREDYPEMYHDDLAADRLGSQHKHLHPDDPERYARPRRYALDHNYDFLNALRRVRSKQQVALHAAAEKIADTLGLAPATTVDAVHDSPAGAVPGVAQAVYGDAGGGTPETARLHAAAAWYGLHNKLPGVAVFHAGDGPDAVYRFRVAGSGDEIRRKLDKAGLMTRILIPHKQGYDVVLTDAGKRQAATVQAFARQSGTPLEATTGTLTTLGSSDPAKARDLYRQTIAAFEGGSPKQMARHRYASRPRLEHVAARAVGGLRATATSVRQRLAGFLQPKPKTVVHAPRVTDPAGVAAARRDLFTNMPKTTRRKDGAQAFPWTGAPQQTPLVPTADQLTGMLQPQQKPVPRLGDRRLVSGTVGPRAVAPKPAVPVLPRATSAIAGALRGVSGVVRPRATPTASQSPVAAKPAPRLEGDLRAKVQTWLAARRQARAATRPPVPVAAYDQSRIPVAQIDRSRLLPFGEELHPDDELPFGDEVPRAAPVRRPQAIPVPRGETYFHGGPPPVRRFAKKMDTSSRNPVRYMSTRDALLAASHHNPLDFTPRAVLADYLEEHEPHNVTETTLAQLRDANTPHIVLSHPTGGITAVPVRSPDSAARLQSLAALARAGDPRHQLLLAHMAMRDGRTDGVRSKQASTLLTRDDPERLFRVIQRSISWLTPDQRSGIDRALRPLAGGRGGGPTFMIGLPGPLHPPNEDGQLFTERPRVGAAVSAHLPIWHPRYNTIRTYPHPARLEPFTHIIRPIFHNGVWVSEGSTGSHPTWQDAVVGDLASAGSHLPLRLDLSNAPSQPEA